MDTEVLAFDETSIARGAAFLRAGKLVAFPTETVYGLGANALDGPGVEGIFEAKGRPMDNPLIVHVGSLDQVRSLVKEIPPLAHKLMKRFWPGPLTLVLKRSPAVPDGVTAGLDTVAVRMPDHPVALALLRAAALPVAAPSANLSGRPSPTTAAHVLADLRGRIAAVVDGGPCPVGVESTVLDVTSEPPVILRPGGITREQLLCLTPLGTMDPSDTDAVRRSPGQRYQHYAPRTPLVLVEGLNQEEIVGEITKRITQCQERGQRVGVICSGENAHHYMGIPKVVLGRYAEPEVVSARLFDALRQVDDWDVDRVFCEALPERGLGVAIMDRLRRAAGHFVEGG